MNMVDAMFRRCLPALLVLASLASVTAAPLSRPALVAAALESANDNIPSGWCGRGIYSILQKAGLGTGLREGNGQEWENILMAAGWKPVRCITPDRAPLGSVLVYMSDIRLGKRNRGTPGGSYGHVEMVALAPSGGRLYVSDCPRPKPGGSVVDNFTGRAWLPPGQLRSTPQPVTDQIATVLEERTRMAMEHFHQKQRELASLKNTGTGG
jgi:hypothetical protein